MLFLRPPDFRLGGRFFAKDEKFCRMLQKKRIEKRGLKPIFCSVCIFVSPKGGKIRNRADFWRLNGNCKFCVFLGGGFIRFRCILPKMAL